MKYWSCLAYYIKANAVWGQLQGQARGVRGQGHRFFVLDDPIPAGPFLRNQVPGRHDQGRRYNKTVMRYRNDIYRPISGIPISDLYRFDSRMTGRLNRWAELIGWSTCDWLNVVTWHCLLISVDAHRFNVQTSNMSVNTDVQRDLHFDEGITYAQNKDNVSQKLDKPNGGEWRCVCDNTRR